MYENTADALFGLQLTRVLRESHVRTYYVDYLCGTIMWHGFGLDLIIFFVDFGRTQTLRRTDALLSFSLIQVDCGP